MSKLIKLVLLYGGKSSEHEIALISAASVLAHLNPERYTIIPIGIDKAGACYLNDYHELRAYTNALPVITPLSRPIPSLINGSGFALDADVIFPVVHGPLYEDGCLQGLLELSGIAYVGCDVLSSSMGMDKDIARRIACVNGVESAPYQLLSPYDFSPDKIDALCESLVARLGFPLMVKPCSLGSSVGIHKATTCLELRAAIDDARRYDNAVLVESFLVAREMEVAVLENKLLGAPPHVSVAGEIRVDHPDGFYSYAAKYLESDKTGLIIPASLPSHLLTRLQAAASAIFTRLKCKGMARIDFFVDEQTDGIYFSEINTIPGFTSISMYPKLWAASGLAYTDLLDQLIDLALSHRQRREKLVTHYQ